MENLAKALNGHAIAWGDIFFKAVINDVDKIRKGTNHTPTSATSSHYSFVSNLGLGAWPTKEMGRWITSDDEEDDRTPSPLTRSLPAPGPISRLVGITSDQPLGQQSEVLPAAWSQELRADLSDTAVTTLHDQTTETPEHAVAGVVVDSLPPSQPLPITPVTPFRSPMK